jgi:hypothetical protein
MMFDGVPLRERARGGDSARSLAPLGFQEKQFWSSLTARLKSRPSKGPIFRVAQGAGASAYRFGWSKAQRLAYRDKVVAAAGLPLRVWMVAFCFA